MQNTIPQRYATPEELADHDARIECTKRWDQEKVAAELVAMAAGDVRRANCPQCWQRPGRPCWPYGDHLARWQHAERRSLITGTDLASAVDGLEVVAPYVVIRTGAR